MNLLHTLASLFDPSHILRARGLLPDPWQQEILMSTERQILLNCSRQSGKSTAVAALALHTALSRPGNLVLLLSPSLRQSLELFRKVTECYEAMGRPTGALAFSQTRLELDTHSRVVCLPGKEETVRSFSGVDLLVIDEAARVPDDLYRAVRPMLAVSASKHLAAPGRAQTLNGKASSGRLVCLSTPFGKRGFFYDEWEHGGDAWQRARITWKDCPRIRPEFIAMEKLSMGESWVRQEYECSFEALEGLVYPDFEALCGIDSLPEAVDQAFRPDVRRQRLASFRQVGGIDFGFRNPFCALWGVLDRDDVLWVMHERYLRETPIHDHAMALAAQAPQVMWYADPAGPTEIEELRRAGLKVMRGGNAIEPGIAAVNARLRTDRLRVHRSVCPNLLAEAKLYRYPDAGEENRGSRIASFHNSRSSSEVPIDQNNHALAALRYLVSRLDTGFIARFRRRYDASSEDLERTRGESAMRNLPASAGGHDRRKKLRLRDEELWNTVIGQSS
jgi:hypothetical protein